jgi:uncharacterized OB-fold protein
MSTVLPVGLPAPAPQGDGLDRPYWDATLRHELVAQRCDACGRFQWGPEWICHHCHAFDVGWAPVPGTARIHSWERVWHPVHPALKSAVPYVVLLVEFPDADGIRMIGNLAGDPRAEVVIGATVLPVFEDRGPYTLVQWRTT